MKILTLSEFNTEPLNLTEIQEIKGGECLECGEALVMGGMLGSMIGGVGGAWVALTVGLGPNCLDIFNSDACS